MKNKRKFKANIELIAAIADGTALVASIFGLIFGKKKVKIISGIVCGLSVIGGTLLFARHFGLIRSKKNKLTVDLDLADEEAFSDETEEEELEEELE